MTVNPQTTSQHSVGSPESPGPTIAQDGDWNGRLAIVLATAILLFTAALTLLIMAAASNS